MTQLRNCDENFEKKDFYASSLLGINKKEKSLDGLVDSVIKTFSI